MPDDLRIVFRRFFALDEHYLDGSGELNLHFSVNGIPVGETDRVFVVRRRSYIELDATWSMIVNVTGLTEVTVRMEMRDADRGVTTDFGSLTHTLRAPFLPREYSNQNQHFSVEWGLERQAGTEWVREGRDEVFACREHEGSVTCTTVAGAPIEARLEIHPVRPTPRQWPVSNLPVRPINPYLRHIDSMAVENGRLPTVVEPGSPLNILPNPPVIPIVAHPTSSTAALVEFTYYFPDTLNFTDSPGGDPRMGAARDQRLVWSAVPVNGGDVSFLGPDGNKGLRVLVYGRTEGEVRLEVRLRGALIATYRALVLPVRQVSCRFNILRGVDSHDVVVAQPQSTPDNIIQHLAIANRYLRQVALELVLDSNPQTHDHAVVANDGAGHPVPGIFNINVPLGLTRNVPADSSQADRAVFLNFRSGVMNFNYIRSSRRERNGRSQFAGLQVNSPNHPSGVWMEDDGTPSSSWVKPTGVEPDAAAQRVRMRLLRGIPRAHHANDFFGMLVSDDNGHPVDDRNSFATTIVHEFGHVLGLGHRNPRNGQENAEHNDRVLFPPIENAMFWGMSPRNQSFDIVQARAVHASRVVVSHSIIAP